jgi:hypothetical protein
MLSGYREIDAGRVAPEPVTGRKLPLPVSVMTMHALPGTWPCSVFRFGVNVVAPDTVARQKTIEKVRNFIGLINFVRVDFQVNVGVRPPEFSTVVSSKEIVIFHSELL